MALVFYLTFNVVGAFLQELLEKGIESLTVIVDNALTRGGVNEVIHSLVIDGIFTGVGSVLSFLPLIVVLFFFLSLLEDTGYMARVAFVTDKALRKIGLSGRSIVPMLVGFGCTVPGVMASRTLPSARDRKLTVLLTPFMSCTAKLPVYVFFASIFFPKHSGLVIVSLYALGIIMGIIVALVGKNTFFKGEAVPFVMELPSYRMPGAKNVLMLLWDKAKDFLERAFSVIFVASIVIWLLQSFDLRLNFVSGVDNSKSILEDCYGPCGGLHGKGKRSIYTLRPDRNSGSLISSYHSLRCIFLIGVLPPLYSLCSGYSLHQKGAGGEVVLLCGGVPVPSGLGGLPCVLFDSWSGTMNIISLLILALVFVLFVIAVVKTRKNKKKGCCNSCSCCSSCPKRR